jgi:hypothetical protein
MPAVIRVADVPGGGVGRRRWADDRRTNCFVTDFPPDLRWFATSVSAVALALVFALAFRGPLPPLAPLVIFVVLEVCSEHGAVPLPSGTLITPGFIVAMASIVVFREHGALLGPLIVGLASGLYLPHLRRRTWRWALLNAGIAGCATLAAALAYEVVPSSVVAHWPLSLVAALPSAAAFVLVESGLLCASYALDKARPFGEVAGELLRVSWQIGAFAFLGLFLGRLYLDVGATALVLFVVPILVAREMFVTHLQVRQRYEATLDVLIRTLETKDRYTAGHVRRVARYACYIGEELGFGTARLERLRYAALMHDIGKLAVPGHLLNKPGRLTADEYARVRQHEAVSFEMLSCIEFLRDIASCACSDHTLFEPGSDRPIEPYIVAVADAYDAMTSTRSYRRALPQSVAFTELRAQAGTQFDPECVHALIRVLQRRNEVHGLGYEPSRVEWPEAPTAGVGSAGLGDLYHFGERFGELSESAGA